MNAARGARAFGLALLAGPALGACATLNAPAGTVPAPAAARQDAFGGWVQVELVPGGGRTGVAGELIAASGDTIWVLAPEGVHAIAAARVQRATVTGYDSRPSVIGAAAALGTLSTLANGYLLILTAPAWVVTGVFAGSAQARAPVRTAGPQELSTLATFARFPQGMPPGLETETLRPRP